MGSTGVFSNSLNSIVNCCSGRQRLRPVWAYFFAAVATAGALGLAVLLPFHSTRPAFVVFTFAITASAWMGGLRAGLLAWVLSPFAALGVLVFPHHTFSAALQSGELFQLGSNLAVSAAGVAVVTLLRAAGERNQELLLRAQASTAEQKRTEEALRYQLEVTQAITLGAADSIFVTDAEGYVTFVNQEVEKVFGFSGQELLGRNLHSAIHHHYPDGRPFPVEECKLSGAHCLQEYVRNFDDVFFRKDGSPVHVSCSNAPVEVGGRPVGMVLVVRDITERKQTEEALLRSEKMALASRTATTIAHEINNPLAAVVNMVFLAQTSQTLPEARNYLDKADAELGRISQITRRALGFYRESAVPATAPVGAILDSAADLLITRNRANQVTIDRQYDDSVQVTAVNGDLRQVFSNLIANSLDAVQRQGTIKLRASTHRRPGSGEAAVRVTIADNGAGIAPDVLPHIFEPFYTTKGSAGTGLGLWVSRQLIEKYGGSIRVRSCSKGARRGTTISVILPAAATVSEPDLPRSQMASAG
jgi:PAS domain S-box-containing protein